MIFLTDWKIAY